MQRTQFWESKTNLLRSLLRRCASVFYDAIKEFHKKGWAKLIEGIHRPEQKNQVQWKIFKRTMGSKISNASEIKDELGNLPSNAHESLDNLARYYSNISSEHHRLNNISREFSPSQLYDRCKEFTEYLREYPFAKRYRSLPNAPLARNDFVTIDTVKEYCHSYPCNVAMGWDDFSPHFLAHASFTMIVFLHSFLSICFYSGVLPLDWTKSNIFALHKKGDIHEAGNFRPISLTPICLRLYERLLLPSIWHVLESNHVIHPFQAGFRKKHSTLDGLYWLFFDLHKRMKILRKSWKSTPYLPVAFLDMSKAFDKIRIPITLKKLYNVGFRGPLLLFFKAFLSNRYIRTVMFTEYSQWFPIDMGTPQGSVLGPILFLVYINDLIIELAKLYERNGIRPNAYADDLCLIPDMYHQRQSRISTEVLLDRMQDSLTVCSKWARKNGMTFSKDKSNIVLFKVRDPPKHSIIANRNAQRLHHMARRLKLSGFRMLIVPHYRYLGITLNCTIGSIFKDHWNALFRSCELAAYKILRVVRANGVPPMVGIVLVQALLRSRIAYGLPLLNWNNAEIQRKLISIMAKPLKSVLGLPFYTSNMAVLIECGFSLPDIWQQRLRIQLAHRYASLNVRQINNNLNGNLNNARHRPPQLNELDLFIPNANNFANVVNQVFIDDESDNDNAIVMNGNGNFIENENILNGENNIGNEEKYEVIPSSEQRHHSVLTFFGKDYGRDNLVASNYPKSTSPFRYLQSLGQHLHILQNKIPHRPSSWVIDPNDNGLHTIDLKGICIQELDLSMRKWVESQEARPLLDLKYPNVNSLKREFYLVHDTPSNARCRAMFRFDKYKFNEFAHKLKLSPTPHCPQCVDVKEHREHVLLRCPMYNSDRRELFQRLTDDFNVSVDDFNTNLILADYHHHAHLGFTKRMKLQLLRYTADFLHSIVKKRFIDFHPP